MVKWTGVKKKLGKNDDVKKVVSDLSDGDVVVVENGEGVVSRRATLFLSSASFFLSLMFLSQNITGNAVANFTSGGANWIGGMFFILSIIGFLVYVQKRKRK